MTGFKRKGGSRPMIYHSLKVGLVLEKANERIEVICGGFLHDLIEDANVTAEEIEFIFGAEIRALVEACSHDNDLHEQDRVRAHEDLFRRAVDYGQDAIVIKVADAADNILDLKNLENDRRLEFIERARLWKTAGEQFCGAQHPLVRQLDRRIRRASIVYPPKI